MGQKHLNLILLLTGLIWLESSWGKFSGGTFVSAFPGTIIKFISKNPYPWYKGFLQNVVLANSGIFGTLVLWGELLTALAIVAGSLVTLFVPKAGSRFKILLFLGLLGGAFLNTIFYLAAGWTSPSTSSLNLLMLGVEVLGAIYAIQSFKKA